MSPDSRPAASSILKLLASMKVSDIWKKMSPIETFYRFEWAKGILCLSQKSKTMVKPCGSTSAKIRQFYLTYPVFY